MGTPMKSWYFRLILPLIWLVASLISWKFPGDEYLLFTIVSGFPGAWIGPLVGPVRLPDGLPILFGSGLLTMGLFGWWMDCLRIRLGIWFPLWLLGIVGLMASLFFQDYERAIARNGSWIAYGAAATNLSLYGASVLCLLGALVRLGIRAMFQSPRLEDISPVS